MKTVIIPSRFGEFTKEYRLPLQATGVFLAILVLLLLLRGFEQSSVGGLIADNTRGAQDYASLLSNDKTDNLTKKDTKDSNQQTSNQSTAKSTSNSSTKSNGSSTSSGSSSGSGSSSSGGGQTSGSGSTGSSGGNTGGSTPSFKATIIQLAVAGTSLECTPSTAVPPVPICNKRYDFGAQVDADNGFTTMGTVSYNWQSSVVSASESGSFQAAPGHTSTGLHKSIWISCKVASGAQSVTLNLTSPNGDSRTLQSLHNNSDCPVGSTGP